MLNEIDVGLFTITELFFPFEIIGILITLLENLVTTLEDTSLFSCLDFTALRLKLFKAVFYIGSKKWRPNQFSNEEWFGEEFLEFLKNNKDKLFESDYKLQPSDQLLLQFIQMRIQSVTGIKYEINCIQENIYHQIFTKIGNINFHRDNSFAKCNQTFL